MTTQLAPSPQMEYGDWVQNWWWPAASENFTLTTRNTYRTILNNYIIPYFECEEIGTITKSRVRHWVSDLTDLGYRRSVIDSAIRVFRATMAAAQAKGLIDANPLVGMRAL